MDFDFSLLPIEIIEIIFEYLTIDDIKDASLTCHKWFEASQRQISEKTRMCFSNKLPQNLILNSNRKLTSVVFKSINIKDLTVEDTDFWIKLGKTITSLSFCVCSFKEKTFLKILHCCPNLSILYLHFQVHKELGCDILLPKYCNKLKSITLKTTLPLSENAFQRINNKTPKIEQLKFCSIVYSKENAMLPTIQALNKLSESLKSLELYFYPKDLNIPLLLSEMENLNLESLKFQFSGQYNITVFSKLVHNLSSLVNLNISITSMEDVSFIEICTIMSNLKSFSISNCRKITNKGVFELVRLKNLERLFIIDCPLVSNEGIIYGIAKCRNEKMKEISLSGSFSDDSLIGISQNLPNLTSLEIYTILFLSGKCTRTIFEHLRWLRILRLESLNLEADNDMFSPIKICQTLVPSSSEDLKISFIKGLQYLVLSGFTNILGASLDDISNLTELIELKLSHFQNLSTSGLKQLGKNCSCLKKIEFSDCQSISLKKIESLVTPLKRLKTLNIRQKQHVNVDNLNLLQSKFKHINMNVNLIFFN